jgi:antitoxin CcdA
MDDLMPRPLRKPVNLSFDPALVAEARDLGVNVSRAAEAGLRAAVAAARAEAWRAENAEAIQSSNDWARTHGLPLERHRLF